MNNSTIQNLQVAVQMAEFKLEGLLIQQAEIQKLLDDESISDELWEETQKMAIVVEGKRIDQNSKLASLKCDLRVAKKSA